MGFSITDLNLIVFKETINPILNNFDNVMVSSSNINTVITINPPYSTSNGRFSYEIDNTDVAIVIGVNSNNSVKIYLLSDGSCNITATQSSYGVYGSASISCTLTTIPPLIPVLTQIDDIVIEYGTNNNKYTLPIPYSSNNETNKFTYTSNNTSIISIIGREATILSASTNPIIITVTQDKSKSYVSASITFLFTIMKSTPTITLPITSYSISAGSFILKPLSNSLGAFKYSCTSPIITILDNNVTINNSGTCNVVIYQYPDNNYNETTITVTLSISNKKYPILVWDSSFSYIYGKSPVELTPPISTNNEGVFRYLSDNTNIVNVYKNQNNIWVMEILSPGTARIIAIQEETSSYVSAQISSTVTVLNKYSPILVWDSSFSYTYNRSPIELTQPTSSNTEGVFSYSSDNTNVVTVYKNQNNILLMQILSPGTATIIATQEETTLYASAQISSIVTISSIDHITPVLEWNSSFSYIYGKSPVEITPPTSTNNEGVFSYSSDNTTVVNVYKNQNNIWVMEILSPGTATIIATQEETTLYASAQISSIVNISLPDYKNPCVVNTGNDLLYAIYNTNTSFIECDSDLYSVNILASSNNVYIYSNSKIAITN
uniref:BIG2 domain-containing protein n=1 Tax=viral metagenome TaxID=1070528 RepID=A0A6C0K139_9ZZZZ